MNCCKNKTIILVFLLLFLCTFWQKNPFSQQKKSEMVASKFVECMCVVVYASKHECLCGRVQRTAVFCKMWMLFACVRVCTFPNSQFSTGFCKFHCHLRRCTSGSCSNEMYIIYSHRLVHKGHFHGYILLLFLLLCLMNANPARLFSSANVHARNVCI